MPCKPNEPFYIPTTIRGVELITHKGDGITTSVFWHQAYPETNFRLAYNIYFSTEKNTVFSEGPKFLSTNLDGRSANIIDLAVGDTYYFAVRATEYDPSWFNPSLLPDALSTTDGYNLTSDGYLKQYPETLLLEDISETDTLIQIADIDLFPAFGVIQAGVELIKYDSIDVPNNTLIVSERGFLNSKIRSHDVDGYDGYSEQSPIIRFFKGCEEGNNFVIQENITFNDPHHAYILTDGYKKIQDILTTDLTTSDDRIMFPRFDHAGWRRTDPDIFFKGQCLDTYLGGENFCADGYHGVGIQIRNISFDEQADRTQEFLLERTGEPVCLFRRMWSGIPCSCYEPNREYPSARCSVCYGTGYINGYTQYFNSRRSDGKILVRFGPAVDDLKIEDAGLESHAIFDCWTLSTPGIKDRDFIIRFNPDGSEEFRYELIQVNRNRLFFGESGRQSFNAQRVRRTDPIYQVRSFRDTSTMPMTISTSVGLLRGPNNTLIPHTHELVVNENTLSLVQINQTTNEIEGHTHSIIQGVVQESLGHTHNIIL